MSDQAFRGMVVAVVMGAAGLFMPAFKRWLFRLCDRIDQRWDKKGCERRAELRKGRP
jgi:hypothetical protein